MKQYINIFIVIGVIVLVSGLLQAFSVFVERRESEINVFEEEIRVELNKGYKKVNFYTIFLKGEELERSLLKDYVNNVLTKDEYSGLLQKFKEAETLLANAVLTNSANLAGSIIQYVEYIKQYIERLSSNDRSFSSDIKETMGMIMDIIDKEINPLLDFMLQKGLFVDELLERKANKPTWDKAKNQVMNIIKQLTICVNKLAVYIAALNEIRKQGKTGEEPLLKIAHFDATASALQVMDNIINGLYVKLSKIFIDDIPYRKHTLDEFIIERRKKLFKLKTDLYDIYGVRRKADDKIVILHYAWLSAEDEPGWYYSDPQNDLLVKIEPHIDKIPYLDSIEKKEADRIAIEKINKGLQEIAEYTNLVLPSAIRVMGMEAMAMLAEAISGEVGGLGAVIVAAIAQQKAEKIKRKGIKIEELEAKEREQSDKRRKKVRAKAIKRLEMGNLARQLVFKIGHEQLRKLGEESMESWRGVIGEEEKQAKKIVIIAVEQEAEGRLGAINKALAVISEKVKRNINGGSKSSEKGKAIGIEHSRVSIIK